MSGPAAEDLADTTADRAGCRRSQQVLDGLLADLLAGWHDGGAAPDADPGRRRSLLPGWSVGHVLTHLARNADGLRRMVDGAARGEVASMYESFASREGDIAAGADRPFDELVADVRTSAAAMDDAWDALDAEGWRGTGLTLRGPVPITDLPWRRWRELEVHRTDLGLGGSPWDPVTGWPSDFVRADLRRLQMQWASRRPMGLTELPREALALPPAERLAWLLGRRPIEGLPDPELL